MKYPKIIGLAGLMGSGKDTAALILNPLGYDRRSFADMLRVEVHDAVDHDKLPSDAPEAIRLAFYQSHLRDVFLKPTPDHMRILLQWCGEFKRSQWTDYWVTRLFYQLNPESSYVLSDVRYANEAAAVRMAGGEVWLIEGRSTEGGIANHASERIDFPVDRVIRNDSTIEQLAVNLNQALSDASNRATSAADISMRKA